MTAQAVKLSDLESASDLKFSYANPGTAVISTVGFIDKYLGRIVKFDRPMLSTKPAEFARYVQ